MPTEKIANPFMDTPTGSTGGHDRTAQDDALDSAWSQEVNSAAAQDVQKRNGAPAGTYVTQPEEYEPIVTTGKENERAKDGTEQVGSRLMATVIARASAKIKGKEVTQILRFKLSPDARFKKVYDGKEWTGEVDESKDDLATRLWANAVTAVEEQYAARGAFRGEDILTYLKTVPVALRTMQGDRGDLIVLNLQNRGRKQRG